MVPNIQLRSGHGYDTRKASDLAATIVVGESMTIQSQREEADINFILRQFGVTGQLPQAVVPPTYGDFDAVVDYQGALELIRAADKSFMAMPAEVRSRFNNNAALFVDFCANPANLPEMRKLGLTTPEVANAKPNSSAGNEAGAAAKVGGGDAPAAR